jgi:hypothetical protein
MRCAAPGPLPALPRSRLADRRRAGCPAGRGGAGRGVLIVNHQHSCTRPKEQQTSTPAPSSSPRCPLRSSALWSCSTGGAPRTGPRSALQCSVPAHPRPLRSRSRWQPRPSRPHRPAGGRDGGLAGRTSNSFAVQARTHQPAPREEYRSRWTPPDLCQPRPQRDPRQQAGSPQPSSHRLGQPRRRLGAGRAGRTTATTLPKMTAPSAGIGWGISQAWPSSRCRVFTVASSVLVPPSRAATISPFSATDRTPRRTARALPVCSWMRGLARKEPECDTLKL